MLAEGEMRSSARIGGSSDHRFITFIHYYCYYGFVKSVVMDGSTEHSGSNEYRSVQSLFLLRQDKEALVINLNIMSSLCILLPYSMQHLLLWICGKCSNGW